mgnify:FL=1
MISNNSIKNMMIWFENGRFIQDQIGQMILNEKPVLSFSYEDLKYYWGEQVFNENQSENFKSLTKEQQQEIEDYIHNFRLANPPKFPGVDVNGNYLGVVYEQECHQWVDQSPPNQDPYVYDFDVKQWKRKYFYDNQGGLLSGEDSNVSGFTTIEPPPVFSPIRPKFNTADNQWHVDVPSEDVWKSVVTSSVILKVLYLNLGNIIEQLRRSDPTKCISFIKAIADNNTAFAKNWIDTNISDSVLVNKIDTLEQNTINSLNAISQSDSSFTAMAEFYQYKTQTESIFVTESNKLEEATVVSFISSLSV